MPVVLSWWDLLGLAALGVTCGFVLGAVAMWHPASEQDATPPPPRTPGPRRAGYLAPLDNAGCYEPRTDWPEPGWPAPGDTFSEIAAGWQRLERNVAGETAPIPRYLP